MRNKKLISCSHCQICNKKDHLHIHHKRYEIGEKESIHSTKKGKEIDPGSILGRELEKDLSVLCSSCHLLWHTYFKKRFLTHKKANQIRRLIKYRVEKKRAFWITKENKLYTPILLEAKKRFSGVLRSGEVVGKPSVFSGTQHIAGRLSL